MFTVPKKFGYLTLMLAVAGLLSIALFSGGSGQMGVKPYIVQAADLASARAAVESVGGRITHELGIIRAVGADLTAEQQSTLRSLKVVRLYDDRRVETAKGKIKPKPNDVVVTNVADDTGHVTLVSADRLHDEGITGSGVTLAVLDSGLGDLDPIKRGADDSLRALAQYDAIADKELSIWQSTDQYGHGTHVQSVSLNSDYSWENNHYRGIAPNAGLVSVKAFDENGQGSYGDVIQGIDWLVSHKDDYNIRVLNLSFSAPPQSYYWDDPLNQAVMALEAIEGTDACIERAGKLCPSGGFTVVKVAKPNQDMRFDVPTVGVGTIQTMHQAGGKILAIEAHKTIILDESETVKEANRRGIAIVAFKDSDFRATS